MSGLEATFEYRIEERQDWVNFGQRAHHWRAAIRTPIGTICGDGEDPWAALWAAIAQLVEKALAAAAAKRDRAWNGASIPTRGMTFPACDPRRIPPDLDMIDRHPEAAHFKGGKVR